MKYLKTQSQLCLELFAICWRKKVVDESHLKTAESEQSLARVIQNTIRRRYGLYCKTVAEMKKNIKQSREEKRRRDQRNLEKPHDPIGAFALFKAHCVSTDGSAGTEKNADSR